MNDLRALLARTADYVAAYREAAAEAAVFPEVDLDAVRAAVGGRLPDGPPLRARSSTSSPPR